MEAKTKRDWGMVIAGVGMVVIGFVLMMVPGLTLVGVAVITGVALVAMGVVDLISYIRYRTMLGLSGWALAYAIASLVLGALFILHPLISASVIPWVAGALLAAYGVFELVAAMRVRSGKSAVRVEISSDSGVDMVTSADTGWGWLFFGGLVSLICGVAFFFVPESFAVFLGLFLIMRGIMSVAYGIEAGRLAQAV